MRGQGTGERRLRDTRHRHAEVQRGLHGPPAGALLLGLVEQRDRAWELLNQIPGVSCVKPQGALYLFPRLDPKVHRILDDERFAYDLLSEEKLLVVHGTGDDNVHIENTVQFVQKLIAAGIPYDLQIYPRQMHSIDEPDDRTSLFHRILEQFEMYLQPETPAADGQ